MTNEIEAKVREELAAEIGTQSNRSGAVAAAAGMSVDEVMAAWSPSWDVNDTTPRRWPEDAAVPLVEEFLRWPVHTAVGWYLRDLGRWPDPEGLRYWMAELEERPAKQVYADFLNAARAKGELA